MRAAPPVVVSGAAAGAWRLSQALLAAAVAGVLLAWAGLHRGWPGAAWLALLGAAAAGGAAWRVACGRPFTLQWDGQRWGVDGRPADVAVMIDLGAWMLLRVRPDAGAVRWLPLPRAEAGPAWPALRAALYARPPTAPARPRHE